VVARSSSVSSTASDALLERRGGEPFLTSWSSGWSSGAASLHDVNTVDDVAAAQPNHAVEYSTADAAQDDDDDDDEGFLIAEAGDEDDGGTAAVEAVEAVEGEASPRRRDAGRSSDEKPSGGVVVSRGRRRRVASKEDEALSLTKVSRGFFSLALFANPAKSGSEDVFFFATRSVAIF